MEAEDGKIAEYKLKGIHLDKGATLKGWDSDGNWYSSYAHKWTNSVETDASGNYKVLMTADSYDFYLKFYSDNHNELYIKALKDVMYFKPNGNTWDKDGAWFAVEYFDSAKKSISWEKLETKVDGYYVHHIPTSITYIKYFRMDKNKSELKEDSKWNASDYCNLANSDVNNAFFQWEDSGYDGWNYSTYNVGSWTNM